MKKDYYSILEITDEEKKLQGDEFKKMVKDHFRKLGRKWHPDKCKDESQKNEYEEKFKEIGEAYSVLSDETKRAQYDNPMSGGGFDSTFSNFNMEDILREFGGFGNGMFSHFGQRTNQPQKGRGIRLVLNVSLEDIYNGVEKTLKYKREEICHSCKGSGKTPQSIEERCSHCGGTGMIYQQVGPWQQMSTCPHCGGKGTSLKNPCPHCGGKGTELRDHEITFSIPTTIMDGGALNIRGEGHAPTNGKGEFGDVQIVIKEKQHETFFRDGYNLLQQIDVPVLDALLGCKIEVKTIDGKSLLTTIPPCSEDGTKIRFSGKGMKLPNSNRFGDMYGIINLVMPKSLTNREKDMIRQLKEESSFK